MRILIVIVLCLSLSGCGSVSREFAKWFGKDEVCVDGVAYLQFASGVSVKYRQDGRVATCN